MIEALGLFEILRIEFQPKKQERVALTEKGILRFSVCLFTVLHQCVELCRIDRRRRIPRRRRRRGKRLHAARETHEIERGNELRLAFPGDFQQRAVFIGGRDTLFRRSFEMKDEGIEGLEVGVEQDFRPILLGNGRSEIFPPIREHLLFRTILTNHVEQRFIDLIHKSAIHSRQDDLGIERGHLFHARRAPPAGRRRPRRNKRDKNAHKDYGSAARAAAFPIQNRKRLL